MEVAYRECYGRKLSIIPWLVGTVCCGHTPCESNCSPNSEQQQQKTIWLKHKCWTSQIASMMHHILAQGELSRSTLGPVSLPNSSSSLIKNQNMKMHTPLHWCLSMWFHLLLLFFVCLFLHKCSQVKRWWWWIVWMIPKFVRMVDGEGAAQPLLWSGLLSLQWALMV